MPNMPRKMNYVIGTRKEKDSTKNKNRLVRKYMPFGGRALFTSDDVDASLLPAIKDIYARLKAKAPTRKGLYSNAFRYTIAGKGAHRTLNSRDIENASIPVIGVTNIAVYASVLENPGWHRTFQKVFLAATRKWKGLDIRWQYIHAKDIGKQASYTGVQCEYFHPTIEVAPAGVMGNKVGKQITRRRSKNVRLNRAGKNRLPYKRRGSCGRK
jgi:hypothetical protein